MMGITYQNVIVAIDGSEASKKAFQKAILVANNNQARLIIAHVIDARTYGALNAYNEALSEETNKAVEELVNNYAAKATEAGVAEIVTCIEHGTPNQKITKDIAEKYDADLIICGARGLNAVERLLLGSVSEGLIRNANCDVLVVR